MLVVARTGAIDYLNPAAETLLGVSRKRGRDHSVFEFAEDAKSLRDLISHATETGQSYGVELELRRGSENQRPVDVTCRATLVDTDGERLLVELLDATSRRQIDRERARRAQHGVSRRIIRQLAHEIRNPLGGLRGAAQLLERELDDPSLAEYTRVIIGEADRLANLMDDLLGPGGPPVREAINVHEITERVAWLLEKEGGGGLSVYRDYDPSLPDLWIDRDHIFQAVLNIGRNAAAATDLPGGIIFRTRAATNFAIDDVRHPVVATIEIEDNGPGVPTELVDTLFYPLVTGRDDGTGLGLPLAQDLVSRHGGLIEFTSRPGKTVFRIRLPLPSEEEPL